MEQWESREILILGMTYPNYSRKYTENACTGGLFSDTMEMVRLFPNPRRYVEHRVSAWNLIRADVTKLKSDPRRESFRMKPKTLEIVGSVDSHSEKRQWLERSPHLMGSIQELKRRQTDDGTSLGIIRAGKVEAWRIKPRSPKERDLWEQKEREVLAQERIFEKVKPLDFPEVKFVIEWVCADSSECPDVHKMALHQWGLHELYRKLDGDADREQKTLARMAANLDTDQKDVFMLMGSFRGLMYNFGLMDTYSAPKEGQARFAI